ncbi:biotin synthase [Geoalkalibacter ferrihydriticus]|uniref:Biotin synthase n=2 Tax=Geoalkalibacter ferrihydriticus TaxID=392333 RepID=A0A0C2HK55_9BACT|nr:biotin synthase BioB [Geoalkalibacter ferrihydriticus]KIH77456.1 biotin synthase [Geoalkalibacter ferrihydriticus DSM 17813]SDM14345.1 biotin synthase [Geoalkalibacter ferrihydriticus]
MTNPFLDKVLAGQPLSADDGLAILQARGAALTTILAGAHHLREQAFGDRIELCSIINAKSGRCGENCSFCAQSAHHRTTAPVYPLKSEDELVAGAHAAASNKSHCYGIVTSGTTISAGSELDTILAALRRIRQETSIEPSASLGLLDEQTAQALAAAGCVTYHHNLETARSFFPQVCTTHDYEEDVDTVRVAIQAGMKVCCGGIFGLGERAEQRVELALTLRDLKVDSVPLNFLNPVIGTPLEGSNHLTPLDCVRIIALFRYLLPSTRIAVCGGREHNLREFQSWMFMAGASGTMVGNYLTTTGRNAEIDLQMFSDAEVQVHAC